jgi:hypothetical protein
MGKFILPAVIILIVLFCYAEEIIEYNKRENEGNDDDFV